MARLSTSALRRIGQAVRAVEATAGKGPRVLADVPTIHARWAKVMSVVEGSPGAGEPYVYAADIYTGRYDETPAERTPIAEDAELWSHIALSVDDWLGVVRVGGHWEVFGATPAAVENPAYYTTIGSAAEGGESAETRIEVEAPEAF